MTKIVSKHVSVRKHHHETEKSCVVPENASPFSGMRAGGKKTTKRLGQRSKENGMSGLLGHTVDK